MSSSTVIRPQKVFSTWPTEIVFSGFEIGHAIPYPAVSIEEDFGYVKNHPIADAYRAYKSPDALRPTNVGLCRLRSSPSVQIAATSDSPDRE